MYGRNNLAWNGRELRLGSKRGRVLASVEPDAEWPELWRVRFGTHLSDTVNLSRAKDAAMVLVMAELNALKVPHVEAPPTSPLEHPRTARRKALASFN
jgi:hypothetical protein